MPRNLMSAVLLSAILLGACNGTGSSGWLNNGHRS
jgi:predicted small secreted protein